MRKSVLKNGLAAPIITLCASNIRYREPFKHLGFEIDTFLKVLGSKTTVMRFSCFLSEKLLLYMLYVIKGVH